MKKWFVCTIGIFLLMPLSAFAAPDDSLLTRRLSAVINLGWNWLQAEEVRIVAREKREGKYAVIVSYSVLIGKDADELSPEERARFRQYLPMCSHLPIARGTSCSIQETVLFVDAKEYGWMPELVIQYRPEMMQAVAAWQEPAAQ